jgi:hypothetical protein
VVCITLDAARDPVRCEPNDPNDVGNPCCPLQQTCCTLRDILKSCSIDPAGSVPLNRINLSLEVCCHQTVRQVTICTEMQLVLICLATCRLQGIVSS